MNGQIIELNSRWEVGHQIGDGGFGTVYEATGRCAAAIKFVPKAPGAGRELLIVEETANAKNVVPVIESGEIEDYWVLVMPRASKSLSDHVQEAEGPLPLDDVVGVLVDVATALSELDTHVVHRDLKPGNILLLNAHWCLADFGISRYTEATTAQDTRKHAMSPTYAAPEQWRFQRATGATDMYALGAVAYELISGQPPFHGPSTEDLREQHLHESPGQLQNTPTPIADLVNQCLSKAPGSRPSAKSFLARIQQVTAAVSLPGLASLQEVNRQEGIRQGESDRLQSVARSQAEVAEELAQSAQSSFADISNRIQAVMVDSAPVATLFPLEAGGWRLSLGEAVLQLSPVVRTNSKPWGGWSPPAFTVNSQSALSLSTLGNAQRYMGRSHSLWYCDAKATGRFAWYETAFMASPVTGRRGLQDPFSLDPGKESAKAVWNGMAEFQVAWPFTRIEPSELTQLINRWATWFAAAAGGSLRHPTRMPEIDPAGTWRKE